MKGYTIVFLIIFIVFAIMHRVDGMIITSFFIGVFASSWARESEAIRLREQQEQQAENARVYRETLDKQVIESLYGNSDKD